MRRNGQPIFQIHLKQKINPNITVSDNDIGLVPELEEREACVYTSTPWHIWKEYPWYEKAAMIAHYRIHLIIEMHIQDAADKQAAASKPPSTPAPRRGR